MKRTIMFVSILGVVVATSFGVASALTANDAQPAANNAQVTAEGSYYQPAASNTMQLTAGATYLQPASNL